jgi:hypothetical protein
LPEEAVSVDQWKREQQKRQRDLCIRQVEKADRVAKKRKE